MSKKHGLPREKAMIRLIANRDKLNPVSRLGLLRLLIEGGMFHGTPAHVGFIREAQQLSLWAQTRLSPQQLHRANLMAEQSKHQWIEHFNREATAQRIEQANNLAERTVREVTHGMLGQSKGISKDQLMALRDGKEIPREQKPRFSQEAMDNHWRRITKHLDPKGHGWNEKEAISRLDALVDADPKDFPSEARNFRGNFASLQKEAKDWSEKRIGYGLMMKRMRRDIQLGRRSEDTHEPNDRDRRRAAVVDAYLKTTADSIESEAMDVPDGQFGQTYKELNDHVPDHLLDEEHDGKPTRRAQIARIVADADVSGEYEE